MSFLFWGRKKTQISKAERGSAGDKRASKDALVFGKSATEYWGTGSGTSSEADGISDVAIDQHGLVHTAALNADETAASDARHPVLVNAVSQQANQKPDLAKGVERPELDRSSGKLLRFNIEVILADQLRGWVFDPELSEQPILVTVRAGDREIGKGLASIFREDLKLAGLGNGSCLFDIRLEPPLTAGDMISCTASWAGRDHTLLETVFGTDAPSLTNHH